MDEVIDILQGAVVYSSLDLTDGFFHIDVAEDSVKYLSFIVPDGQYECLKAPFGFTNSPAIFQRFINTVFKALMYQKVVAVYLDDLAVPWKSQEDGVEKLKQVLDKAEENGLLINTLQRTANPKFSGFNWVFFRRFIQNFSRIAKPLSDLTRKDVKFEFGDAEKDAFIALKAAMCDNPVLKMFNPESEETEVHTDACKFGLGAVLMQKDSEDRKMHPVYYLSFKTTPAQHVQCTRRIWSIV